jgi:hypothetical protein
MYRLLAESTIFAESEVALHGRILIPGSQLTSNS